MEREKSSRAERSRGTPTFQGWKDGEDLPEKMEGTRLGGGGKILRH